jgi:hypothetical protein
MTIIPATSHHLVFIFSPSSVFETFYYKPGGDLPVAKSCQLLKSEGSWAKLVKVNIFRRQTRRCHQSDPDRKGRSYRFPGRIRGKAILSGSSFLMIAEILESKIK